MINNTLGLKQTDLEEIILAIKNLEGVEEAIIFGSRAKGNYKSGSDVDIALKGKTLTPSELTHLSYYLNQESLMPYHFDILNYKTISNADLLEHIDRIGVVFYKGNP